MWHTETMKKELALSKYQSYAEDKAKAERGSQVESLALTFERARIF